MNDEKSMKNTQNFYSNDKNMVNILK